MAGRWLLLVCYWRLHGYKRPVVYVDGAYRSSSRYHEQVVHPPVVVVDSASCYEQKMSHYTKDVLRQAASERASMVVWQVTRSDVRVRRGVMQPTSTCSQTLRHV